MRQWFGIIIPFIFSWAFAQAEAAAADAIPEYRPTESIILLYGDAHRDFAKLARMFDQARELGVEYVVGGGDLTDGRSVGEIEKSYKFIARQLHWLKTPPYNSNFDTYSRSNHWIEIMGNKEEYGFLRPDRKSFGRRVRHIVSEFAHVPDNKPDEPVTLKFPYGGREPFILSISHMPVIPLPHELRGNTSEINLRNILWPPNWPLPLFPGPEPSTRSSMQKSIHPENVDLAAYFHVHVAAKYKDPVTGTAVISPGSPSKSKVPNDQRTATYVTIHPALGEVWWHDIDDDGKVFWTLKLDSPKFQHCRDVVKRISKSGNGNGVNSGNSIAGAK